LADRLLEAPPPRRRIVERDGRLVAIDSGDVRAGNNATRRTRLRGRWFERTSFDGRGILTTRAWYDLKGPRRLALDPWSGKIARVALPVALFALLALLGLLILVPWLLVVAIPALIRPKLWKQARERLTARLDRFPAATQ